jgi:hypothetical protein
MSIDDTMPRITAFQNRLNPMPEMLFILVIPAQAGIQKV